VDGSATAAKAAEAARDLAIALGASLHVVTSFERDRIEVVGTGSDRVILGDADAAERVAQKTARALRSGNLDVSYYAVHGTPAHALIRQAEIHGARVIVVGNRRMRGLGRVLGSVANSVAHNAPCDVYVVKTDEE
jgi:nucleotide-binding universal stress UspA family protein